METQTWLEPSDLRSRLTFDYQVVTLMSSPLMVVKAYRNIDDVLAHRDAIASTEEGHMATHYRVDYHIKTLIGPGQYSDKTTVRLDLNADNDYPFSQPACFVIDSPTPWSPHFLEGYPICIGQIWEDAKGSMLLGELMVHVAKLLNFDEPEYAQADYVGYNGEAIRYWETTLGRRAISKLVYPPLPDLVYGISAPEPQPAKVIFRKKVSSPSIPPIRLRSAEKLNAGPARITIKTRG